MVVLQMHSLKLISADAFNSVMPSQPLVQKREIRVEEIQDAAVFLDHGFKEQLGLFEHGRAEGFVKSGEEGRVRRDRFQAAQLQPLTGKTLDQSVRFPIF